MISLATEHALMVKSIWIVSPHNYPHGHAFDEIALALSAAFRTLGREIKIVRDPAGLADTTIVLGCNLLPHMRPLPSGRLILFNLEQIAPESRWLSSEYLALLSQHTIWDYSDRNITKLARLGIGAIRCGIGYVPELTRIAPAEETIDVLFVGSINERRGWIFRQLASAGARVEARFNVYGKIRDELIARSKLVLNIHYYESRVLEIVRVSYLLANRRCVVSETGLDLAIEAPLKDGIAFAQYDDLAARCMELLHDEDRRRSLAQSGFDGFSALSQVDYLRQALAATHG
jgi:hypothetical protein